MLARAAIPALTAALLFGASTPFAKLLIGEVSPLLLAGMLYLGSGVGLGVSLVLRRIYRKSGEAPMSGIPIREIPWFAGAIVAGGMVGPALLMLGLSTSSAASASLLLNVEGVLTAVIAWVVFRENADRSIVLGMVLIVAGGVILSLREGAAEITPGSMLILGACLCWAIDNNLTRKVSTNDAMLVACLKGLLAGACNVILALGMGTALPPISVVAEAMLLGFVGYGVSLTLFVIALRTLGTARTGAYFSVAPLFGVAISFMIWPGLPEPIFWIAAALMGLGVWLHIRERHDHVHTHEPLEHEHPHSHDEHHQHDHAEPVAAGVVHTHKHVHGHLTHKHPHYPDIHHQHVH